MDDKNLDESLRDVFRQLAEALPQNPYVQECTIYTFAVSAVYSMYRAHQLNYRELPAAKDYADKERRLVAAAQELAKKGSEGQIPDEASLVQEASRDHAFMVKHWLGGFHLNNAIFRLEACFEQIGKHVTNFTGLKDYSKVEQLIVATEKLDCLVSRAAIGDR